MPAQAWVHLPAVQLGGGVAVVTDFNPAIGAKPESAAGLARIFGLVRGWLSIRRRAGYRALPQVRRPCAVSFFPGDALDVARHKLGALFAQSDVALVILPIPQVTADPGLVVEVVRQLLVLALKGVGSSRVVRVSGHEDGAMVVIGIDCGGALPDCLRGGEELSSARALTGRMGGTIMVETGLAEGWGMRLSLPAGSSSGQLAKAG